jgi:hypothetical protein
MKSFIYNRYPNFFVVLTVAAIVLSGCESDIFGGGKSLYMMTIEEVSGNNQIVPPGGVESDLLIVRIVDQDGSPHRGLVSDWTIREGEGSLNISSSASDANGRAQVIYKSANTEGEVVVEATLSPGSSSASIPVMSRSIIFLLFYDLVFFSIRIASCFDSHLRNHTRFQGLYCAVNPFSVLFSK